MRIVRMGIGLSVAIFCTCFMATSQEQKVMVTGKLARVMAIGGESTGWAIQLDSETSIDGKQLHSIEVQSREVNKLERLENRRVRATGKIAHRHGVETGDRAILDISSIEEVTAKPAPSASASHATVELIGSEWLLEDLAGSGVIDNVQATLAFPEAGKVSGNGSCNRFFGPAQISGDVIELGPLGATRMACPEAVMNQETKYLSALQKAERFEWKDPYLLLHSKGFEKPLRFTRKGSSTPAAVGAKSCRDLTPLFSRIWRVTNTPSKSALGSIYIFLANGTLLETSCVETYRIASWTIDKAAPSVLRVVEDHQVAFTATITELTGNTLRLQQNLVRSKEKRNITLKAVESEFVCPDLPK